MASVEHHSVDLADDLLEMTRRPRRADDLDAALGAVIPRGVEAAGLRLGDVAELPGGREWLAWACTRGRANPSYWLPPFAAALQVVCEQLGIVHEDTADDERGWAS